MILKIAVDVMSGDHGIKNNIDGCIQAVNEFGVSLILVGKENEINTELNKYNYDKKLIEIINAQDVITNEDKAGMSIRKKKESSMVKALYLVKEDIAQGVISSGNTGALLSGATLIVGRIKGIKRPALAPIIPTEKDGAVLIDAGANVDSKAKYLQQFGIMGSIYAEKVLKKNNPKVGLANIGEEATKGNLLVREAFPLLEEAPINFIGSIEIRDVFLGDTNVIVCDGFVGNTILKVGEGLAKTIFKTLKMELLKSFKSKIGAFLLKDSFRSLKAHLDYTEYGGAPFLGVNGCVIKAHGSSDAKAIKNAIRQAKDYLENEVTKEIGKAIREIEEAK